MTTTTLTTIPGEQIKAVMPDIDDIRAIEVGKRAPYVFGEAVVTGISYRGYDVNGKLFVCYYVETGAGSTMSARQSYW